MGEGRHLFLSASPFTLTHYLLNFDEGREYELNREASGVVGRDSWRPPLPDPFTEIPATLATSCGTNPQRVYLLTSAPPSASETSQAEVQLAIGSGQAADFDRFLLG